jgi:hypothetical protein
MKSMPKTKARKQMKRLFENGGLLQEGGTVDEASGNEVPTGSLKKEVRDDIPAQLSEGEFVFPADVVRFIGLQKLMELRQAAKEGLAKMESMGQMGNADEATEEDTGEFETELDDILDEIEDETEEKSLKKAKGGQLKMAAGGAVPQYASPFSAPFAVERYSKEGEDDVFIPTLGGQAQSAIPEGFQKTTKVQSFGGVYRKPEEAQQTVTSSLNLPTTAPKKAATTDLTKSTTTDLTKTEQPIPSSYSGLDTEISQNKYIVEMAKQQEQKYAADNKAKGRTFGQGQVFNNPLANVTDLGTKEITETTYSGDTGIDETKTVSKTVGDYIYTAFDSIRAPDGKSIFDHESTFLKAYKAGENNQLKEVDINSLTLEEAKSGNVLFYVGGKTGGANRERMAQLYKPVEDSFVPVGPAKFYKGAHPDADIAGPAAMFAAIALAPFTGGASMAIGEAILGAGAAGAATVGGAIMGAVTSGITAAAVDGDVKKAMLSGAVSGGIGANAMDITKAVLGPELMNSITQATSLSAKQISNIFSGSIASGVNTAIQGGDFSDMLKTFGQNLVTSGVSEATATKVMSSLVGTVDPNNLKRIGTATKMLSNVALNASLKGLDVTKAIQYYAPTVMTRALTIPGGG